MELVGALFFGFFGLFMGSFLQVLADRLPRGETVVFGRSHCEFCKKTLSWYELLPVFSFLLQKGRCLHCNKKLSVWYPLSELTVGILFALGAWYFLYSPLLLVSYLVVASAFYIIFVADVKTFIIPDSALVVAIFGISIYVLSFPFEQIVNHVLSAVGIGIVFWALWAGTREKGMGFGDVKLSYVLGFLLGFPKIISGMYIAFVSGAVVGIILLLLGKKRLKSRVPFGPFLIAGCVVSIFTTTPIDTLFKDISSILQMRIW